MDEGKEGREYVERRDEIDRRVAHSMQVQRRMPIKGPHKRAVARYAVSDVDEYLRVCRDAVHQHVASPNVNIFYRGQPKEYCTPGTDEILLLPSGGRPGASACEPSDTLVRAYRRYWDSVMDAHFHGVGITKKEIDVFRRARNNPVGLEHFTLMGWFQNEFVRRADSPYTLEATAQHYGLPTLNLDVTWSPLVALFFALHGFMWNSDGALESRLNDGIGVVNVLAVSSEPRHHTQKVQGNVYDVALHRHVDLFDLFYDNDSRPRRQAAALLTEVGDLGYEEVLQMNHYATYITCVIEIPPEVSESDSGRQFVHSVGVNRLFPGSASDSLYKRLRRADPSRIIRYASSRGSKNDPLGRFEYLVNRRILLVGSDAGAVRALLRGSWFARQNAVEVMPIDQAKACLRDRSQDRLDAVVACEPVLEKAHRIAKDIELTASRSNRITVVLASGYAPGSVGPKGHFGGIATVVGEQLHRAGFDSHESDAHLQNALLRGLLTVSRLRTQRWLSGIHAGWQQFLDWRSPLRTY